MPLTRAFGSTAKTIMHKSTTGKDLVKWCIILAIFLVAVFVVIKLLRMHYKRQKEKTQETVDILNTPLDHQDTYASGESSSTVDEELAAMKAKLGM